MVIRKSEIDKLHARRPERPPVDTNEPEEVSGFLGYAGDIVKGVAFGGTEAVRSIYGLADFATGDWLPDWNASITSAPQTGVGKIVGSIAQFAIPYAGLSKVYSTAAAGLSITSKSGKTFQWLAGVKAGKTTEAVMAAHARGDSVLALSRAAVLGNVIARETVKGGLVDFLYFENTGERLSDVIQSMPELENPISEFLAGDPEDSEVVGRLKNVLEGAALGSIFDTLVHFSKGLAAGARVQKANGSINDIRAAQVTAVDDSIEALKVKNKIIEDTEIAAKAKDVVKVPKADINEGYEEVVREEVTKRLTKNLREFIDADPKLKKIMEAEGVTQADEIRAQDIGEELAANKGVERGADKNPRKMSAEERKLTGVPKTGANLARDMGVPDAARDLERAAENLEMLSAPLPTSQKEYAAQAIKENLRLGGLSYEEAKLAGLALEAGAEDVNKAARLAMIYNRVADQMGTELGPKLTAFADEATDVSIDQAKDIAYNFQNWLRIKENSRNVFSALGRNLRLSTMPLTAAQDNSIAKRIQFKPLDTLLYADAENFDAAEVKGIMAQLSSVMKSPDGVDNLLAAQKLLEAPWHQKALAVGLEWHINALLSGVGTQVVNVMSAVNMTAFRPIERLISAGIEVAQGGLTGNTKMLDEARIIWDEEYRTIRNLFSEFTNTFKMMRQSGGEFKSMSAIEGPSISAISTLGSQTNKEGLFDFASSVINIPGKALRKGDEFIKTWNGMARSKALLESRLIREGVDMADVAPMVQERLEMILASKGNLRHELTIRKALTEAGNENIPEELRLARAKELMNYSDEEVQHLVDVAESSKLVGQEATFTTEVADGVFGAAAQAVHTATQRVPAIKFLIPFVNTPVNIADAAWDRTIGGVLGMTGATMSDVGSRWGVGMGNTSRSVTRLQKMLSSTDPRVRQQAKMNMVWGIGSVSSIALLASSENMEDGLPLLTGSGPTNPDVRKSLEAAGWQPFSIKIGDRYLSYSRADPFASMLGIVADASEYIREHNDDEGSDAFQVSMMGVAASIANNITSKTYAQGLANMLDMVMDPDRSGERVLGSVAGSFIPTILANTEKVVDPDLQEIRSWTDKMLSRIPGLSSSLAPRRDLLGDVIRHEAPKFEFFMPIRVTNVKDGTVAKELSQYAYGFSQPLTTKGGVDLLDDAYRIGGKQEAYDRYLQLSGTVKVRGKDLRQALKVLIKSKEYKDLPADEGPNGEKSPRINLINSVIRTHRATAWEQLLKESPALRSAVKQAEKVRTDRRRGRGGLTL